MNKAGMVLLFSALILFSLGLVMVFNTTAAEVLDRSLPVDTHYALIRQMSYGFFGIAIGIIVWKMGYHQIIRLSPILLFVVCILLLSVYFPKIGQEINGAKRWIGLFGFTFQPSEIAKYILPIYFIHRYIDKKENLNLPVVNC